MWKTEDGEVIVVGSMKELTSMAVDPEKVGDDLHRPFIDEVVLKTKDGREAHRVEDVFDCWFESGSMPFAQMHYPFQNKEQFEQGFPADFITEYIGQTRGWFYTLHVLAVALFGKPAFKHSVAHGIILGTDNRKMSKRLGNYPELDEVFNTFGADAVRVYLLSSSLFSGETAAFDSKALLEVQRNVIQRLGNIYSFFKMYADIDQWQPAKQLDEPESDNLLDTWMLSRLNETIAAVTSLADEYDVVRAMRTLSALLDDTSNWFVRRSRRRFWKSEDDQDKQQAYETLHYTLMKTIQLLAPWAPFITDRLWRELKVGTELPGSVHLSDWPETGTIDQSLLGGMTAVREVITIGLAKRAEAKIKVRQPLAQVTVPKLNESYVDIIAEELNVKSVNFAGKEIILNTEITEELRAEGVMRELVRHIQNLRKTADLQVNDRIILSIQSDEPIIQKAIAAHKQTIMRETLAEDWSDKLLEHTQHVKLDDSEVTFSLEIQTRAI